MLKVKTKYEQVIDFVTTRYLEKDQATDCLLPSEPKLAKELGMSRYPINKAFNNLVAQGKITRVPGVGSFISGKEPKRFRSKALQKHVGIASFSGTLPDEVLRGIQDVLAPQGYLLSNVLDDNNEEGHVLINRLITSGILGLMVIPHVNFKGETNNDLSTFNKAAGKGVTPLVLERSMHGFQYSQVIVDNAGGTAMAVDYLLRTGHKTIAYIGKDDYSVGEERYKGYLTAMTMAGQSIDKSLVYLDRTGMEFIHNLDAFINNALDGIVTHHPECQAFVTFGSTVAYRLFLELKRRNKLHKNICFAGFDPEILYDSEFNKHYILLKRPLREIGRIGAETLLELLKNEKRDALIIKKILPEMHLFNDKTAYRNEQTENGL